MEPWQLRLYRHSLMKKDKVRLVSSQVDFSGCRVLDIGCSNGAVSCFLKKEGGEWVHADLDLENLRTARPVLGLELFQMGESRLPLGDNSMDLIMALDILEHLEHDRAMVGEIFRILRPGGSAVVSTPISGGFFLINYLKRLAGMGPEIYGHVREGYSLAELTTLLNSYGFSVIRATTYAKFFTELFEFLLNLGFTRLNRVKKSQLRSGAISPSSSRDLDKHGGLYRLYTRVFYPLVRLVSRLDLLLPFKTGYATLVIVCKPHN
ncbi:MAG: class I SAM-dependent methyltransferase [Candidatus Aminicenantes bacterium]|nr:class I SAM-dependent methyltransferase [Candidatus Aminicenantes bacterium]